jgi:DNA polymerase-3 subunit gamma/tau
MSYLVLARKWRPRRFQDLLGQDHVAVTLRNAIRSDRVAHAFLFTGVRGVGKTSAARILSMALNCETSEGPTPEPCGTCGACTRIISGSCVDVQEIDGASNNSVDDVRNLRETVVYRPSACRTKIYIIDEVHMLSQSAFNALLKTLEEPPPHVKFIFATTEPHRIPVTILSRCQRFDFRKIPTAMIEKQISTILGQEKIEMEADAVTVIAREADGSMRDALSLLDQIIAAFGSSIRTKDVLDLLGIAGSEVNVRLSGALLSRDVRACLDIIGKLDHEGYNLPRFFESYLVHVRDMIVIKTAGKDAPGLNLARWEVDAMAGMVGNVELPELYRIFTTVSKTMELAPYAPCPKILFETTFIKLSQSEPLTTIEKVLRRLGELRTGGAAAKRDSLPPPPPSVSAGPAVPGVEPKAAGDSGPPPPGPDLEEAPPQDTPEARKWEEVVEKVTVARPGLGRALRGGLLLEFGKRTVKIGFASGGFGCNFVKDKENTALIRDVIEKVTGARPELQVEEKSPEAEEHKKKEENRFRERRARIEEEARSHPVVAEAIKILGGDIVDIKTDVE